jgi:hypothetical protein
MTTIPRGHTAVTLIAQFVERVPVKGRWEDERKDTRFTWIPAGCRTKLTKPDDAIRFGVPSEVIDVDGLDLRLI